MKPWARYEIGFMSHPKFLALDGNAIALWWEGKNYCDTHLTDGLIPSGALKTFRFGHPKSVAILTRSCGQKAAGEAYAPLWETSETGFMMHDYLEHNDSRHVVQARIESSDQRRVRDRDRQAKWRAEKTRLSRVTNDVTKTSPLRRDKTETETVQNSTDSIESVTRASVDLQFAEFRDAYPADRRKGGAHAYAAYLAAIQAGTSHVNLMAALSNHKQSEQWLERNVVPAMDKWLGEERWRQVFEPSKQAPRSTKPALVLWAETMDNINGTVPETWVQQLKVSSVSESSVTLMCPSMAWRDSIPEDVEQRLRQAVRETFGLPVQFTWAVKP